MIGTKFKWNDILRYICKCRVSDYKLSVDHSSVVHIIVDHELEQLEDELSLPAEKSPWTLNVKWWDWKQDQINEGKPV